MKTKRNGGGLEPSLKAEKWDYDCRDFVSLNSDQKLPLWFSQNRNLRLNSQYKKQPNQRQYLTRALLNPENIVEVESECDDVQVSG